VQVPAFMALTGDVWLVFQGTRPRTLNLAYL